MNIALAQVAISSIPNENFLLARQMAGKAAENGAHVLIFPEMFMALPRKNFSFTTIAEPLDGPFVNGLREIARKYQLYIIAGVWEKLEHAERVANVAIMLSPRGELLTAYRKLHLYDALNIRESDAIQSGKALPEIVSVGEFKMSLAVCYDLRFPELFRCAAARGANVIILPAAWYSGTLKETHWLTLLRARAIENTCYIAGANMIGSAFCGRSAVFDPFGVQLGDAGEQERLLFVGIDAQRISDVRAKLPSLSHIRTDIDYFPDVV